jgi:hypothetical protein
MPQAANLIFSNTLAAARTVSANSIKVFGVVVASSATNPTITFSNTAGTQVLKILCPTNNTIVADFSSPWLTDGLTIAIESANTTVTVYYAGV